MTVVLLAAGVGSRLRPLTSTRPKCLLPLGGIPLLERTLRSLSGTGIRRCLLVTGYYHEMVENFVRGLGLPITLSFIHNPEYETTNNSHSLRLVEGENLQEGFLLMDADIVFDPRVVERLLASPHEDALLVRHTKTLGEEEVKVQLDSAQRVLRIGKDVEITLAAGESVGIEKFSGRTASRLFAVLGRRNNKDEFYEAAFQEMIDSGVVMHAVACEPYVCMEIDTPDDLSLAERLIPNIGR
jgi:choline kinase